MRIYPAPLPSDIFWENFDCPTTKRRLKTLLMGLSTLRGSTVFDFSESKTATNVAMPEVLRS